MAEEARRDGPGEPPEEYREFRGMMNSADRQYLRRMVERLTERIRSDPGDTESLFLRGLVYRDLGEMEQALADFGAAVELEPNYGLARYARGITNLNLGEFDRALQDFDAVIGLDPDNAAALRGRGVALGNLGRNGEAMRDLDRALDLDPDNVETLTARGLTHTSLERHELAIETTPGSWTLTPAIPPCAATGGSPTCTWTGTGEQSRTSAPSFEIEPDHAAAHLARGFASDSLGEHGEVLRDYDRVIELTPDDPEGYYGRGCAYARPGPTPPGGGGLRAGHRPGPGERGVPAQPGNPVPRVGEAGQGGAGLRRDHPPGPQ